MIDLEIVLLNDSNTGLFNQVDNSRIIMGKAILFFDREDELRFKPAELSQPYGKGNECLADELDEYLKKPDRDCFIALREGKPVGQMLLQKYWNNLASIEDIRVSREYRNHGIGKELIRIAIEWSEKKGLKGIRLETQDTNVEACRFYRSCGFKLRGMDRALYSGLNPEKPETALYWYMFFGGEESHWIQ